MRMLQLTVSAAPSSAPVRGPAAASWSSLPLPAFPAPPDAAGEPAPACAAPADDPAPSRAIERRARKAALMRVIDSFPRPRSSSPGPRTHALQAAMMLSCSTSPRSASSPCSRVVERQRRAIQQMGQKRSGRETKASVAASRRCCPEHVPMACTPINTLRQSRHVRFGAHTSCSTHPDCQPYFRPHAQKRRRPRIHTTNG